MTDTPSTDEEETPPEDDPSREDAGADGTPEESVDSETRADTETAEHGQTGPSDGGPDTAADESIEATRSPAASVDQADGDDDGSDGAADPSTVDQEPTGADAVDEQPADVPEDVRKYARFKKIDGSTYDRANDFLRERTYITAREWAIARLCADFRTETGVEMTKIGENLPELVPFMTDTYTPQAVNQARASFEEKVRKAGATFLYGAMCDFFTAEELDDVMYEATEVAKFLLEVEGVDLAVEDELDAEDRISSVMRDVREQSAALRHDEVCCPECGHEFEAGEGSQ